MNESTYLITCMELFRVIRKKVDSPMEKCPRMLKKKKLVKHWGDDDYKYEVVAFLGEDGFWYHINPQFCGTKKYESTPLPDNEAQNVLESAKPYLEYLSGHFEPLFI